MSKTKIMNFKDGAKEIKVGDTVVITNGQNGYHFHKSEEIVKAVGTKYVLVGYRTKFDYTGKEKTIYSGGSIYSSMDAYNRLAAERKFISEVADKLRYIRLTYTQSVQVKELLGL